jgi:hypothetical protein
MNALTFDLIATILSSVVAIASTGLAVWILPWQERDWEPRALPAKARTTPPQGPEPTARHAHATLVP